MKQDNLQCSGLESQESDKVAAVLELCDLFMFGLQSEVHTAVMAALEGISYFAVSFYHLKANSQIGSHCNITQVYTFFQECFQVSCSFLFLFQLDMISSILFIFVLLRMNPFSIPQRIVLRLQHFLQKWNLP